MKTLSSYTTIVVILFLFFCELLFCDASSEFIEIEIPAVPTRVFYCDPINGKLSNDGSLQHPWPRLQDIIEASYIESQRYVDHPYVAGSDLVVRNEGAPVKSGSVIFLLNGNHGKIEIIDYKNKEPISILAMEGHNPEFEKLRLLSCSNFIFDGITIHPLEGFSEAYILVHIESSAWNGPGNSILLQNCILYSVLDISSWGANLEDTTAEKNNEWNNLACNGITIRDMDNVHVLNNSLLNVNYGIQYTGNFGIIRQNTIENFAGDALRGVGNDLTFEYNYIANSYDVNENHDDGFQSWSPDGVTPNERIILRGNVVIDFTDPDQPYKGDLQGLGCFDGPISNWLIENNVVMVEAYHGISLWGAYNCTVINNTVIGSGFSGPWIMFHAHKNGTVGTGNVIRNNICRKVSPEDTTIVDHNYILEDKEDYLEVFADYVNRDFHLKAGSPAIDFGIGTDAPSIDQEQNHRPAGLSVDAGAYEFGSYKSENIDVRESKDILDVKLRSLQIVK